MKKGEKHLRKVMDEEKAAKELLEDVQERTLQLEDEMWQELDNCIVRLVGVQERGDPGL